MHVVCMIICCDLLVPCTITQNTHTTLTFTHTLPTHSHMNSQTASVTKQLLHHTGVNDDNAFVSSTSSSNYYCRLVVLTNGDVLYLCMVLADEDISLATLNMFDPSGMTHLHVTVCVCAVSYTHLTLPTIYSV